MKKDKVTFTEKEYAIIYKAIKIALKYKPTEKSILCIDLFCDDDFGEHVDIMNRIFKKFPKSKVDFLELQPVLNIVL